MNWYKNLSLKTKFLIMNIVIFGFIIVLCLYSAGELNSSKKNFTKEVTSNQTVTNDIMSSMEDVINMRFTAFQIEFDINDGDYDVARNKLTDAYNTAKSILENYIVSIENFSTENTKDRQEMIDMCNRALVLLKDYYDGNINYVNLQEQGKTAEALAQDEETTVIINELFDIVYSLPTISFDNMVSDLDVSTQKMTKSAISTLVVGLITVIIVAIFTVNLTKNIVMPIQKLKDASNEILKGNLEVNTRTNVRDEIGELSNTMANVSGTIQCIIDDINSLAEHLEKGDTSYRINIDKYRGAFKDATNAINIATSSLVDDALYVADSIKEIEQGKFENNIKQLAGDKDVSTEALRNIQLTLKAVSGEINSLINAAINGNLEYKLDSSNYSGEWKDTIEGLNKFVESVVVPIKETQNALNQFSVGNFSHRITNEYKGEFNNIKQTVNYTAQTIGSYITEISNILNKMANKNFDVSIDSEYLGDFKTIQESVNLIVNNLNMLIKDIISSAEQVSGGSKQISESSLSLAEGATQQAESVEKLNFIIKKMSEQTIENASNFKKANELANETRENASKGSQQMNSMLVAMEDINTASNSISNIIKVIDDISFQTNILALNAAVEAARAGEHGKGFAVVAEEVRSLAARSQQAARETTELIESSVSKVAEGSRIANQTADALLTIVDQIESISGLVDSCAKSSLEQEYSISEVAESVTQISNVTQNNAATSQESAAASEELASQAEVFYASVADFKLKNEGKAVSTSSASKQKNKPKTEKPSTSEKNSKNEKISDKKDESKSNSSPKSTSRNVNKIDLSSDDMIILDDDSDIIINESLDFGKY